MQGVCGGPQFQFNYIADRPLPPLSKGGGAAAPEGFLSRWHPYFFKLPVGAGHARPARFRKLSTNLKQQHPTPTTPATSASARAESPAP